VGLFDLFYDSEDKTTDTKYDKSPAVATTPVATSPTPTTAPSGAIAVNDDM
jgi:hypothetical protein